MVAVRRAVPLLAPAKERLTAIANRFVYTRANQVLIDGALVAIAASAAYLFRFDGELPPDMLRQLGHVLPFAVMLTLWINALAGVYSRIWRFFGLRDAALLAASVGIAFAVSVAWRLYGAEVAGSAVPFGVLLMFPVFAFATMTAARFCRRLLYRRLTAEETTHGIVGRKRLLLVGAGEAGLHLVRELRDSDFEVVGFVDDDEALRGRRIGCTRVLGTTDELETIVGEQEVDEVILCLPTASKSALQRLAARCDALSVKTSAMPTLREVILGQASSLAYLPSVSMESLLGRHSITHPHDAAVLSAIYGGKRILVTGAGGSIGSELVRQLRRFQPAQLILLDKDENNLYEIACEIREDFDAVVDVIADIRNRASLEKLFQRFQPEVVFHAAAYKHVPLMECYPAEAILNNVMGTRHVAELSRAYGVSVFVLISTDKAVNPSNAMGASKRVAEMIVQSLASPVGATRFCCVRFGNVLGSRASVVPIFQRQIRQGKSITVTHPDVTRYFMTIPEAVQLVIQAGSLGAAGEIFLLDMGEPVKIVDLARHLIELSGLVPEQDIAIEFTGLRPGEKLDEELLTACERNARTTCHSKILVVRAIQHDAPALHAAVAALERAAHDGDVEAIHGLLRSLDIGYHTGRDRAPDPAAPPIDMTHPSRTLGTASADFASAGSV
jgi:FlaA1/EpsC-like NDP-sugar epimerase